LIARVKNNDDDNNNNNNHTSEASEVTSPRQLLTEFSTIFAFELHRRFYSTQTSVYYAIIQRKLSSSRL